MRGRVMRGRVMRGRVMRGRVMRGRIAHAIPPAIFNSFVASHKDHYR
jgi:ribosomal protein L35AE/L33A